MFSIRGVNKIGKGKKRGGTRTGIRGMGKK